MKGGKVFWEGQDEKEAEKGTNLAKGSRSSALALLRVQRLESTQSMVPL